MLLLLQLSLLLLRLRPSLLLLVNLLDLIYESSDYSHLQHISCHSHLLCFDRYNPFANQEQLLQMARGIERALGRAFRPVDESGLDVVAHGALGQLCERSDFIEGKLSRFVHDTSIRQ